MPRRFACSACFCRKFPGPSHGANFIALLLTYDCGKIIGASAFAALAALVSGNLLWHAKESCSRWYFQVSAGVVRRPTARSTRMAIPIHTMAQSQALSAAAGQLDAEARELQRKRDFARSIPLWDRLCALKPSNWEYPLALGLDLKSAGRITEADETLGRGARAHPDALWLGFHWALLALDEGRLVVAEERARKLLDRFEDPQCFELLGDIAVQRRDMRTAERAYATAVTNAPSNGNCTEKLNFARAYNRLAQSFPKPPTRLDDFYEQADYAVLVINLDHNPDRLEATEEALRTSPVPVYRVPGVRGGYLPTTACEHLTRGTDVKKGTLGTFLAHVAAWEFAAGLKFEHCLIIEDDARPIIDLPFQISALQIPADFDVCFVNERMQCRIESYEGLPAHFAARRPIETLRDWPTDRNAPGGDGYFLSRAGVRKLLDLVARDGFAGDVDWRLVAYGTRLGGLDVLRRESIAYDVVHKIHTRFNGSIDAYTLVPCLIQSLNTESMRLIENSGRSNALMVAR